MKATLTELESNYKKTRGKSRQLIKETLDRCYEVKDDLNVAELELIWYIRRLRLYRIHNFIDLAEKMYDAEVELKKLKNSINEVIIDKK